MVRLLSSIAAPAWRHPVTSRGCRLLVWFAVSACVIFFALLPAAGQASTPPSLQASFNGQIVDVTCDGDSQQSYALYLPSSYTPAKPWPIIYFFDPGGRGRRPVELYKDIAGKYGFVLAGSNNSRNHSSEQARSVNAIWLDTHRRLAIDARQTYASGFSGGARVAGQMALSCPQCEIAGVIANGAGYPTNQSHSTDKLLYFFAVGNQDFNWSEVMTLRREREDKGLPYRVRVFSGPHQWAPADTMEDAVEWMMLRAMQSRVRPADAAFIDRLLRKSFGDAEEAGKENDALAQFHAYRSLASDFFGLRDVTEAEKKLAVVKKSPAFKTALKKEQEQIDDESSLESEVSPKLHTYISGNGEDEVTLSNAITQGMLRINDQAEHSKNESKRLVAKRAFDALWVSGIESGEEELEARHFARAAACFDLMSKVSANPWPVLLLAETYAAEGNKKQTFRELKEAVRRGLKDADAIESNARFQVFKADPEFQSIVQALKQK